ncbi:spore coat protein GerQ [Robertmurraya korlensis]|uniref:spore coat protein GerQ n=1 Tax=Robertmurraya korlensis TaxID=519977 RepID=UPI002040ACA3|nr:spore coat protein GerQ [Robertmurraya korlensis]MCM3601678.1 spore coat protein GerQ [Robertmurraya korlensis]
MSCQGFNYYPTNYHSSLYPSSMTRESATQPAGFPGAMPSMPSGPTYSVPVVPMGTGQQLLAGTMEESFIENILRYNKGKIGTFYFTYQGNSKWNAMVYHGRVETAGRDHIIISDPTSGKRYLLMMANLDWVEFDEEINYPFPTITPDVQATLTTSD